MSPSEEGSAEPVVIERLFDAPSSVVWAAITDKDRMRTWYFGQMPDFKPAAGFETRFDVHEGDQVFPHIWKVVEAEAVRKIAYTWRYEGFPGESLVTFELAQDGERTRLVLTHSGLETFRPQDNPRLARDNFVKGWTSLIARLAEHVEKVAAGVRSGGSAAGASPGSKPYIDPTSRKGAP